MLYRKVLKDFVCPYCGHEHCVGDLVLISRDEEDNLISECTQCGNIISADEAAIDMPAAQTA